ncbi:MAG: integrase [Bauldia sp.]|nr:MAG: integrase [Bauldia sp.]
MALMMGSLYDALRSGGIEDDKARKAAEEVAGYENRLASIESRLGLLTWMVGFNIAFTVGVLLKLFA